MLVRSAWRGALVVVVAALSGCDGGEIGPTGGGGATSQGGHGTTSTTANGGSGGSGAAGGGGSTSSGGGGSGGTGNTTATGGSGGSGGSGGAPNEDPCAGKGDGNHCGSALGGLADHNSVYSCSGGATAQVMGCPNGCENGSCIQPPTDPCANASSGDGAYCNASLGAGEEKTLYQCQNGMTASKMACPNGCKVQPPGVPDSCIPGGDPCANASSGNGLYCGSGIGGDPNKLYDCQNQTTASFTECNAGCQVMPPGVADACAPTGGGECCLAKPPGVLTQSYTACGSGGVHYGIDYGTPNGTPIYAGMSGTVVSHALGYPNCYNNGCSPDCWNAFNYVKIKSDCGDPNEPGHDFFIYYLHIESIAPGLGNGSHVDQGQLLAHSGNSGCSSGPHIHIETASVPAGNGTSLNTCNSENPSGHYCQ